MTGNRVSAPVADDSHIITQPVGKIIEPRWLLIGGCHEAVTHVSTLSDCKLPGYENPIDI